MSLALFKRVEALQDLLIAHATGQWQDDTEYKRLRSLILSDAAISHVVPTFVRTCRDTGQFWQFVKKQYDTYAERRDFLWGEFRPLLDFLERPAHLPSDGLVVARLEQIDAAQIQAAWSKALERRTADPEGAITMARTLLETVCKHILTEAGESYDDSQDINKLYRQTADKLKLAPSQHTELVFKQILGGCTAVIEGLGALRNRLGDSHGKSKGGVKPAPRHAELAVNLAGALAIYLISTWDSSRQDPAPAKGFASSNSPSSTNV